ncbi:MAG: nucleoside hydrolase [Planctomycetia bacterium]|nr:nucleoside hydrolase [Planctomycetia bacterium]
MTGTTHTPHSRRNFLTMTTLGAMIPGFVAEARGKDVPTSVTERPILHLTDLFHPHGDPDDHFDLATVFALQLRNRVDLRGISVDYPPAHRTGDPAVAAIAQMNRLCATAIPIATGSSVHFTAPDDVTAADEARKLPLRDTGAIRFIHETLRRSNVPVAISCVGAATDIAWAAAMEPELFREKCAGVYLNAGSAGPDPDHPEMLEFNVRLNPAAYAAMFRLPCPVYWYPCWHQVELRQSGEFGTFWWLAHRDAFDGVPDEICHCFQYMFDRSDDPRWLMAIESESDTARWEQILTDRRGMWSTASLLHIAGLTVLRNGEIVPEDTVRAPEELLFRMEPVHVTCDVDGRTTWRITEKIGHRWIFHCLAPQRYPEAMTRAMSELLRTFR